ncbi:FimB/Mfa2 family fimbrial subunit [Xylanibacter oryzae]|uniref:FimB/Mfa2 family fimbrial subunit n=1 Tax=Xylanibacter oryzae TaxID=185293 RepID=UPI00055CCFD0|nr:FimB/Mfa2 family fimbrial subunit [Xylanibacter oryzae]
MSCASETSVPGSDFSDISLIHLDLSSNKSDSTGNTTRANGTLLYYGVYNYTSGRQGTNTTQASIVMLNKPVTLRVVVRQLKETFGNGSYSVVISGFRSMMTFTGQITGDSIDYSPQSAFDSNNQLVTDAVRSFPNKTGEHVTVSVYQNPSGGKSNAKTSNSTYGTLIWSTTLKTAYEDIASGYIGTIDKNMANTSTNYAYYYCHNYSDGTTKSFTNSGWYLPSAGDWWDVTANLGSFSDAQKTTIKSNQTNTTSLGAYVITGLPSTYFDSFNTKLSAAGGDQIKLGSGAYYFWCASEIGGSYAVRVLFVSSYVYLNSDNKISGYNYVRAVLAY